MKKLIVLVIVLAIISGAAFAADNQSAAYMRMLSRESATDSIDIAYFNPAGTAFLQEGFHVQLNNQFVWLNYEHTSVTLNDYTSVNFIPLFPTGYVGYSGGNWAAFLSYTIPDGGGSLKFDDGIAMFEFLPLPTGPITGSLEASSATHSFNLGGSYRFGDSLSIGLVGHLVMAVTKTKINILTQTAIPPPDFVGTAETTQSGIGYGGTFGIHYRPIDAVNIAVTVESGQKIAQDLKESSGSNPATIGFLEGFVTSSNTNADRPWRIRAGASYDFAFGLQVPVSFKYDFYKAMDSSLRDSYSVALALRYWLLNDVLEISVGSSYDIDEFPSVEDYNPLNPELSSVTIAGGIGWEIIEDLKLDIGVLYPFYFAEEASAGVVTKMNKQVVNLAVGIGYVF